MGDPPESTGVIEVPFTPGSSVQGEDGAGETAASTAVGVVLDAELCVEVVKEMLVHAVGCNVTVAAAAPPELES
jgi:hypothetical protein